MPAAPVSPGTGDRPDDAPIESGDVVRLRSGGPPMTVEDVYEDEETSLETADCAWFDRGGRCRSRAFRSAGLVRCPAPGNASETSRPSTDSAPDSGTPPVAKQPAFRAGSASPLPGASLKPPLEPQPGEASRDERRVRVPSPVTRTDAPKSAPRRPAAGPAGLSADGDEDGYEARDDALTP